MQLRYVLGSNLAKDITCCNLVPVTLQRHQRHHKRTNVMTFMFLMVILQKFRHIFQWLWLSTIMHMHRNLWYDYNSWEYNRCVSSFILLATIFVTDMETIERLQNVWSQVAVTLACLHFDTNRNVFVHWRVTQSLF